MAARLDSELVSRGISRSRERAKELIKSGAITVNGIVISKPSYEIISGDIIENSSEKEEYVGRGALKLEKAHDVFGLDFSDRTCLDIGASTGGFTEYMLRNGAAKVFAVDVGHDQLAEKLRADSRVVNVEGTDIRTLTKEFFGGGVDFICADVSFISLTKIIPKIYELLADEAMAAVLIKPQFEAGKSGIGKHGIVKNRKIHERVLREIDDFAATEGFYTEKYTYSPVKGGSGNIEYLVKLVKSSKPRTVHDFRELTETAFKEL